MGGGENCWRKLLGSFRLSKIRLWKEVKKARKGEIVNLVHVKYRRESFSINKCTRDGNTTYKVCSS